MAKKTTYALGEWEQELKDERILAWKHKQHLDSLSDFTDRLQYWQEEVSKSGVIYDTIFTEEPGFILSPEPQNDEDRRQLAKFRIDWYRNSFIKQRQQVFKYGWTGYRDDPEGIAFVVQSIDFLIIDLEKRLASASRPTDLTKRELLDTSKAIDAAGYKVETDYAKSVDKLRHTIETNRPIDYLLFDETTFGSPSIYFLALVWDIVYYEKELKDRLAYLENKNFRDCLLNCVKPEGE